MSLYNFLDVTVTAFQTSIKTKINLYDMQLCSCFEKSRIYASIDFSI